MNHEPHTQADLAAFEERLRGLQPRGPLHSPSIVLEEIQVNLAHRDDKLAGRRLVQRSFYRTVGISASLGAMLGAACTLLLLQHSAVIELHQQPTRGDVVHAESHPAMVSATPSPVDLPVDSEPSDKQLLNSNRNSQSLLSWLNDPYELSLGRLGIGSRLLSQSPSRADFTQDYRLAGFESTFEVAHEHSQFVPEPLLPQRQWMQLMLNSPEQLF